MSDAPSGLRSGGSDLWVSLSEAHELDAAQLVTLLEVCRAKDRLDWLDAGLQANLDLELLKQANATANLMKQLIAALRLPDESGKRPQHRGPRVQKPSLPGGSKVSSIERARSKSAG